jgi:methane monooxygenase PmoA-like
MVKKYLAVLFVCAVIVAAGVTAQKTSGDRITVVPNEAQRRVDISIDGKPFTSYIYPEDMEKPTLYPLRTATGTLVTRGFPRDPRPGERIDHPHHVGLWFNYGNVNNLDFWNNSYAIKPEDKHKMGTVYHHAIVSAKSGANEGTLEVDADWDNSDKKALLQEHTKFIFKGGADFRSIDRITTLKALGDPVVFHDDKEGLLGMRVRRELEQPSTTAATFTDANGRPTTVMQMDNTGVNGNYLDSEGKSGDAVWGTRGRWCMLSGKVGDEPVSIVIFDNPANPGFPTYWHARGYGLFAANPLGRKAFDPKAEEMDFTIPAGQSATFRYRVMIFSRMATPENIEAAYKTYISEVK